MATDFSDGIRLTDANDDQLGLLLVSGKECPFDADTCEGRCVFLAHPNKVELFDEEPYQILQEHEDTGEQRYRSSRAGESVELEISGPLSRKILVTFGPGGSGEWGLRRGSVVKKMGFSQLLSADDTPPPPRTTPEQFLQWTPEELLQSFESWNRKTGDLQFSDGIPVIRAWMELCAAETVSQADLDRLLSQFGPHDGTHIHELWNHVVHWGRWLGLSVPRRSPWACA